MPFDSTTESPNEEKLPFEQCSFATRIDMLLERIPTAEPIESMIAACHDLGDLDEIRIGVLRRAQHSNWPQELMSIVYSDLFIEGRAHEIAALWTAHTDADLEYSAAINREARAGTLVLAAKHPQPLRPGEKTPLFDTLVQGTGFDPAPELSMPKEAVRIFARDPSFIPVRQSAGAAGVDLKAYIPEGRHTKQHPGQPPIPCIRLEKDQTVAIPNGFSIAVPLGYEMQIRPRSGLSLKGRILVITGTIDADYRGPVKTIVRALSNNVCIEHGERISQAIISPILTTKIVPVASAEDLGTTERGEGGFGSTGRT